MAEPQFGVRTSPPEVQVETMLEAESVTPSRAMAYLGWFLVYIAFAPPIAVILWRLATMAWGGNE